MGSGAVLTFVSCEDDARSAQVAQVVSDVIEDNRAAGLQAETIDVDQSPERAVALGVMESPTVILTCDGVERGRMSGTASHRALLHMILPELYRDPDVALGELRRQLDSPGEHFPRRVLKRHERIGKAARVTMLRNVPLFGSLSKRDLAKLGNAASEVVLDAGSTLMREGEPGDACWVVADGSLSVRRGRRTVNHLGPGDVVGEMALLYGGPRTATVTADERCVLLSLDRKVFRASLTHSPELALALLEEMSQRLHALDDQPTH